MDQHQRPDPEQGTPPQEEEAGRRGQGPVPPAKRGTPPEGQRGVPGHGPAVPPGGQPGNPGWETPARGGPSGEHPSQGARPWEDSGQRGGSGYGHAVPPGGQGTQQWGNTVPSGSRHPQYPPYAGPSGPQYPAGRGVQRGEDTGHSGPQNAQGMQQPYGRQGHQGPSGSRPVPNQEGAWFSEGTGHGQSTPPGGVPGHGQPPYRDHPRQEPFPRPPYAVEAPRSHGPTGPNQVPWSGGSGPQRPPAPPGGTTPPRTFAQDSVAEAFMSGAPMPALPAQQPPVPRQDPQQYGLRSIAHPQPQPQPQQGPASGAPSHQSSAAAPPATPQSPPAPPGRAWFGTSSTGAPSTGASHPPVTSDRTREPRRVGPPRSADPPTVSVPGAEDSPNPNTEETDVFLVLGTDRRARKEKEAEGGEEGREDPEGNPLPYRTPSTVPRPGDQGSGAETAGGPDREAGTRETPVGQDGGQSPARHSSKTVPSPGSEAWTGAVGEGRTPVEGGYEQRIAAVRSVPASPWGRAVFAVTGGRLNPG